MGTGSFGFIRLLNPVRNQRMDNLLYTLSFMAPRSAFRDMQVVPCEAAGLPIKRQVCQDPTRSRLGPAFSASSPHVRPPWWLVNSTTGGLIAVAFGLCDTGAQELETLWPSEPRPHFCP